MVKATGFFVESAVQSENRSTIKKQKERYKK